MDRAHETDRYIDTRRVGDAVVSVINDGSMLWTPGFPVSEAEFRRSAPDADDRGRVRLEINACLIRLDGAVVLIDPGADDPDSDWQRAFELRFEGVARTPGLAAGLAELGLAPDDITHVLITHYHFDHIAGLTVERDGEAKPRFPGARHLIGRDDWEKNPDLDRPDSESVKRLVPLWSQGILELVDDGHEVAPGLTMHHAPGESLGHSVVRLRSGGETFYFLGDLFHHPCEVENFEWVPPGRDPAASLKSRQRIYADAVASNALLVAAHERFPPWGRIRATGDGFRWERT
jgi:glyoxylase-like metal-dependent hydrolase (beta-lactamase superfamily II)